MKRGPASRGFTLIELLIAVAVFAVMGAMAYGGLNSVLDTQQHARQQMARLRNLQYAVRILQRDVELAVERQVRDQLGDPQPALLSAIDPLLILTQNGWPNTAGQLRSHLVRVAYRYEDGGLYRLTWTTLDGITPSEAQSTLLLDKVEGVEFRFMGEDLAWKNTWPPPQLPAQTGAGIDAAGTPTAPGTPAPATGLGSTGRQPAPITGAGAPGTGTAGVGTAGAPGAPGTPGAPGVAGTPKPNQSMPKAIEITFTAAPYGRIRRVFALAQ